MASIPQPAERSEICRKILRRQRSMTVLKLGFVRIRSDRLDETVALFRDVIGVSVTRQTDDLVGFRLADGTVLELYGPTNEFHIAWPISHGRRSQR